MKKLSLADIMIKRIQGNNLETNEEVLAFHHLMKFLYQEEQKEDKERNLSKWNILNIVISNQIFHSYQTIWELINRPEKQIKKMIPFIYCFQDFLIQKGMEMASDEEKIAVFDEALLFSQTEPTPCRLKTILSNNKK